MQTSIAQTDSAGVEAKSLAILIFLLVIYAWDRVVLAIALPDLRMAIDLSPAQLGLISTAFSIGIAVMALPAGVLIRRVGLKPVLMSGAILFSVATIYPPLASGFVDLLLSRVLLGCGEGVFHVALILYLGRVSARRRAASIGMMATVFGVAISIGPPAIQRFNAAVDNWHMSFYLLSAIGLALSLLLAFVSIDRAGAGHGTTAAASSTAKKAWTRIFGFWPLLMLIGAHGLASYSLHGLLPTWSRANFGFTPAEAAVLLGAFGAGAMLGGAPLGAITDRFKRAPYALLIGSVMSVSAIGLMAYGGTMPIAVALATTAGLAAQSLYVTCVALAQDCGGEETSTLVGLMATVYYGAASMSGLVLIAISENIGFRSAAVATYGGLYAIALLAFYLFWMRRDTGVPTPDRYAEASEA
jgi:MFS transporter, DHA1 family, inner membrane transport protein